MGEDAEAALAMEVLTSLAPVFAVEDASMAVRCDIGLILDKPDFVMACGRRRGALAFNSTYAPICIDR